MQIGNLFSVGSQFQHCFDLDLGQSEAPWPSVQRFSVFLLNVFRNIFCETLCPVPYMCSYIHLKDERSKTKSFKAFFMLHQVLREQDTKLTCQTRVYTVLYSIVSVVKHMRRLLNAWMNSVSTLMVSRASSITAHCLGVSALASSRTMCSWRKRQWRLRHKWPGFPSHFFFIDELKIRCQAQSIMV